MKFEYREIPPSMLKECEEWRGKMIEAAAEGAEDLLNKYLESGELSDEEIKRGLRARALKNEICLVTCGSAFKNKGVQAVLDADRRIHALAGRRAAGQRPERARRAAARARPTMRSRSPRSPSRS